MWKNIDDFFISILKQSLNQANAIIKSTSTARSMSPQQQQQQQSQQQIKQQNIASTSASRYVFI